MSSAADPSELAREAAEIGQELPARYQLLGHIGYGAFATVWRAFDRLYLRTVAIKRFLCLRGERRGDFYKELAALSQLEHERIVKLYDLRETNNGRQYLILEYCEGGTLRQAMLRQSDTWPHQEVARLGWQIAQGLEAAHQLGLTHRDLKPENLLFAAKRQPAAIKIADFGLARTRRTDGDGRLVGLTGSPAYMAPEQFRGQWCQASDLYGLGVILYELLHARLPFEGSPGDLARQHLYQKPRVDPKLPRPWPDLLERLLDKVPENRPTATECLIRMSAMETQRMSHLNREKSLQRDLQLLRTTLRDLAEFGEPLADVAEPVESESTPAVPTDVLLERSREQLARLAQAARVPRELRFPRAESIANHLDSTPLDFSAAAAAMPQSHQTVARSALQDAQTLFNEFNWGSDGEEDLAADEELPLSPGPNPRNNQSDSTEAPAPPPETLRNVNDVFSQFGW